MRFLIFVFAMLGSICTQAQVPHYVWGQCDSTANLGSYITSGRNYPQAVAARNGTALWCNAMGKSIYDYCQDYRISEIDTLGAIKNATTLIGEAFVYRAEVDAAGNWYLFGSYRDTIRFANGKMLWHDPNGLSKAPGFIAQLQHGTLEANWLVPAGDTDEYAFTECFSVAASGVYYPSSRLLQGKSIIYKLDLTTGARTKLWEQSGGNNIAAIKADNAGNVCLVSGSASPSGISFNGSLSIPPVSMSSPWFIARYKNNGQFHWAQWMNGINYDIKGLTLDLKGNLYVSSVQINGPSYPPNAGWGPYLAAKIDSNGAVLWTHHHKVELSSRTSYNFNGFINPVFADTALYLFCGRKFSIPGNIRNNGVLVSIGQTAGDSLGIQGIEALGSVAQQIATDGRHIWVTGVGIDSTEMRFDSVRLAVPQMRLVPFLAMLEVPPKPVSIHTPKAIQSFFTVSPNPASQTLTITSEKGLQYHLLDAAGRILLSGTFKGGTQNVSVGSLPRGFYLLEGISVGSRQVQRVVLE